MYNEKSLAREFALQTLFQHFFVTSVNYPNLAKLIEENPTQDAKKSINETCLNFAKQLVDGVQKHQEQLDKKIQHVSPQWKIERMALIDLTLLRLATYEMLYENLKPNIAIDEAVKLAKIYGTPESRSFINALLDSITKEEQKNAASSSHSC